MPPICEPARLPARAGERERAHRRGVGQAHEDHRAVALEQPEILIEVVLRAHRVEDEVEAAPGLAESLRVARDDEVVRPEREGVLALARRVRQHGHARPERGGVLHPEVPQTAEADDRDLLPLARAEVPERRVRRDPRAQERRGAREVHPLRDADDVGLVHDDRRGVAAVSRRPPVALAVVVGARHALVAVLLLAREAGLAPRHESTKTPTPTVSPTAHFVTSSPTLVTFRRSRARGPSGRCRPPTPRAPGGGRSGRCRRRGSRSPRPSARRRGARWSGG